MAAMTASELRSAIEAMQEEAQAQGGKLVELALPQDLYEEFYYSEHMTEEESHLPAEFVYKGVRIHTGDGD